MRRLVYFEDGRAFVGTFFTLSNVKQLMDHWSMTAECAAGRYFWAADAIAVRRLDEPTIRSAIEDLVGTGALERALSPMKASSPNEQSP
ncbi:MAG: hypothetical protein AB7L28_18260 [Kofleriaceae bacterium]